MTSGFALPIEHSCVLCFLPLPPSRCPIMAGIAMGIANMSSALDNIRQRPAQTPEQREAGPLGLHVNYAAAQLTLRLHAEEAAQAEADSRTREDADDASPKTPLKDGAGSSQCICRAHLP